MQSVINYISTLADRFKKLPNLYKYVIIFMGLILLYLLFTRGSVLRTQIEPFQVEVTTTGTGLTTQLDDPSLVKSENSLGLNVFDILENKLEVYKSLISQLKNAGEKINNNTISEAELEEVRNSYNEFINFKNGLMNFLGQSGTPKPVEAIPVVVVQIEQIYKNTMDQLTEKGYLVTTDEKGHIINIVPSIPIMGVIDTERVIDTEIEEFVHKQLIKRIGKLERINQENSKYYKKLNKEQRSLLLEVIEKRNNEIKKLKYMLSKIQNKIEPLAKHQQEQIKRLLEKQNDTTKYVLIVPSATSTPIIDYDSTEDNDIIKFPESETVQIVPPTEEEIKSLEDKIPDKILEDKILDKIPDKIPEDQTESGRPPCLESYGYDAYKYFCRENCKRDHENYAINRIDGAKPPLPSTILPYKYSKEVIEPPQPYSNYLYYERLE